MKTIRLYGKLAKKFGKEFKLDVKTPSEAIKALTVVVDGFKEYMSDNRDFYTIYVGYEDKVVLDYHKPFSDSEVLRIIPVVTGAGSVGRIILGIALVFVAPYVGVFIGNTLGLTAAATLAAASAIQAIGFSLILGGVSELLFGAPSAGDYELTENQPSYAFNGAINTTKQGNPVSIGYGKLRVGSQVISAGLQAQPV